MSPRLALYGMLARAALTQTYARGHLIFLAAGVCVTLIAILVAAFGPDPGSVLTFGWTTPFAYTLLVWTGVYMPGVFKLNSPANAQLTPGMRARLIKLSAAVWLVCVAGLVLGLAGRSTLVTLPALWLILFSLGMSLSNSGNRIGSVLSIVIWPLMMVNPLSSVLPDWLNALTAHPAFLPLASMLLVAPALAAIRTMIPLAGDGHWRRRAAPNPWRTPGTSTHYLEKGLLHWVQVRALRHASKGRDMRSLLLHGTGAGLQLGVVVPGVGMVGVLGLALLAMAHASGSAKVLTVLANIGWLFSLLPLLLFQVHMLLLMTLEETRAGHGLLRLAPAMPASATGFNDVLASALLRAGLASWASASFTALGFAWLSGADGTQLGWLASLCLLAAPALAVPLRNHARQVGWSTGVQWLLVLAVSGMCVLASLLADRISSLPVLPVAAGCALAFTVAMVVRRRHAMLRAPVAFPAGRLD